MRIRCVYALAVAAGITIAAACGGDTNADSSDLSGTWLVAARSSGERCSPNSLPKRVLTDSTRYLRPPLIRTSQQFKALIRRNGSSVIITPLDAQGKPQLALAVNGNTRSDGVPIVAIDTSATLLEGPRADGHQFYASMRGTDTSTFLGLVLTPPGHGLQWELMTNGSRTYVFREGGADGTIYTTCIVFDTANGSRI